MRDLPRHIRARGITCVDPHPATLACPPLREEESSEALERTSAQAPPPTMKHELQMGRVAQSRADRARVWQLAACTHSLYLPSGPLHAELGCVCVCKPGQDWARVRRSRLHAWQMVIVCGI